MCYVERVRFQRFFLHCDKSGTFLLKLEEEAWEFEELAEALKYAQHLSQDGEARLSVYDSAGRVTIETFV
jgi:hypothetical protein